MLIYRVEDASGVGPYQGIGARHALRDIHSVEKHPSPFREWGDKAYDFLGDDNMLFGFDSIPQLLNWFGDALGELEKAHYVVTVFTVANDAAIRGRTQCAFDVQRAERIAYVPCQLVERIFA